MKMSGRSSEKQLGKKRHGHGDGYESEGEEPKRFRRDEIEEVILGKGKVVRRRRSWSWCGSLTDTVLFEKLGGERYEAKQKQEGKEGRESKEEQREDDVQNQDPDMKSADVDSDFDSDHDTDFSEADSDSEDCTTMCKEADRGWRFRDGVEIPDFWFEDGRECYSQCHMLAHKPMFRGELYFELFKVRLIRNQKFSSTTPSEGELCGEIALFGPCGDVFVSSYYLVREKDPDIVSFNKSGNSILLPLSGANHGPIAYWHGMALTFYLSSITMIYLKVAIRSTLFV